jgi:hypothetical protein
VFAGSRYFDVFVEYAKAAPEDILIRITICNRGPDAAPLHVLPTLWFRNTWSWARNERKPELTAAASPAGARVIRAAHAVLGEYALAAAGMPELLFTENETNSERLFGSPHPSPYVKDAFHDLLIRGRAAAVDPAGRGTKAAAHYRLEIGAGQSEVLALRLSAGTTPSPDALGRSFEEIFARCAAEADEFYAALTPAAIQGRDRAHVMRQALAGMLWSKQYYWFDLDRWLEEHAAHPGASPQRPARNREWFHMLNADVLSMPDKWEYPWFAAWDLAFHAVPLAMVDSDFAKHQLETMLRDVYLHPSGQIPAYEWNFGDVNPPVHAWATLTVYNMEKETRGRGDTAFLRTAFHKLLMNFTWWVNRKDPTGRNVFEGGFLGLDNVGVFDRSKPLPTGGFLEQADGTAWMAFFALNMLDIAVELAEDDPLYVELAVKFIEHFLWIAAAMDRVGVQQDEMWDEEDGFFYDLLRFPDGSGSRLKVRSVVGLLSIAAVAVLPHELVERYPEMTARVRRFLDRHPEVIANITPPNQPGVAGRRLLGLLNERKLRRVLARLLDEGEFLSPYGIRSLSRHHLERPYVFAAQGTEYRVAYEPAESASGMFGGNSNWRGPIWFPVNFLILRGLVQMYTYYGDDFRVECPTGSGRLCTLWEVVQEIGARLVAIFERDPAGRRAVFGGSETFQTDPQWRDHLLFYEYFHGENGAGIGASHQTGWTGVIARIIQLMAAYTREQVVDEGFTSGKAFPER